jgi:signal transduction histidine kinase
MNKKNYLLEAQKLSHDLKTPMMILKGTFLQDETLVPSAETIKLSVKRLIEMSHTYLDAIAEDTQPKILDSLRIRDVRALLKQKLSTAPQLTHQSGFNCHINFYNYVGLQSLIIDEPHPQFIQIQTREFHRILDNIFINAIEAMSASDRGRHTLSCSLYLEEQKLCIDIQDTGCGCDADTKSKIKARIRCSTKPQGRGLGLSRSQELLNSWGASLNFESQPDKGSTITLKLPLHSKPQAHEIN